MCAQVIDFVAARLRHRPSAPAGAATSPDFTFWSGASGRRYVHTRHGLVDCPEVDNCNVVLVRTDPSGRSEVLHVGRLEHEAPSLNLAEIRQVGATLGANEVHLHLIAGGTHQRRFVELDLQAALVASSAVRVGSR